MSDPVPCGDCCAPPAHTVILKGLVTTAECDLYDCSTPRDTAADGEAIPSEEINQCERFLTARQDFSVISNPLDPPEDHVRLYGCYNERRYGAGGCPEWVYGGPSGCGSGAGRQSEGVSFSDPADCTYGTASAPFDDPAGYEYRSLHGVAKIKQGGQWKIRHTPTATCYLKVWVRWWRQDWRLKSAPCNGYANAGECCNEFEEDGAPALVGSEIVYEWEGEGSPCFAEPTEPPDAAANMIEEEAWRDIPSAIIANGEGVSFYAQMKHTIVRGEVPAWPA